MNLYFIRHGDAEHTLGIQDHDRQLTPKGIARTQNTAIFFKRLDLSFDHIFSSPRVRAKQTAEIIANGLGQSLEIREDLNFSFDLAALQRLLAGISAQADVMLVGHNPTISAVVSQLCGTEINMKKGALARVDLISTTTGELVWLVAPKLFDVVESG